MTCIQQNCRIKNWLSMHLLFYGFGNLIIMSWFKHEIVLYIQIIVQGLEPWRICGILACSPHQIHYMEHCVDVLNWQAKGFTALVGCSSLNFEVANLCALSEN